LICTIHMVVYLSQNFLFMFLSFRGMTYRTVASSAKVFLGRGSCFGLQIFSWYIPFKDTAKTHTYIRDTFIQK
jgi:hypothetical protein